MKKTLLASILAMTTGTAAFAQYTGPTDLEAGFDGRYADMTVQQILAQPKDDMDVKLQGQLVRQVKRDIYLFSDGSGEIRVEIDSDDFPMGEISESTTVILLGEVDTHRERAPDIDVDRIAIAQ